MKLSNSSGKVQILAIPAHLRRNFTSFLIIVGGLRLQLTSYPLVVCKY